MSKKVIAINMSPRKNWNTAKLLKSAVEGAKSVGAEVEYIDLYDLKFTGCRSCMLCKRKNVEKCKCYWKDDLSPIIDKIFNSDTLFIGTPIYLGRPTSHYFALMERLHFCSLSYDNYSNYFTKKVNVAFFVTMNATLHFYEKMYKEKFENYAKEWNSLNGKVILYPSYNTLQVKDYDRYDMTSFDKEKKKKSNLENFPIDLHNALNIGKELSL